MNAICLKGIKIKTLIGIRRKERKNKQYICINCILRYSKFKLMKDDINKTIDYKIFLREIKLFIF